MGFKHNVVLKSCKSWCTLQRPCWWGWCSLPWALCWCSLQRSRHSGGRDMRGWVRQGVPEQRSSSSFVLTAYGRAACRWFTLKSKSAGPCRGPTSGMLGFEWSRGWCCHLFSCVALELSSPAWASAAADIPLRSVAAAGGLLVVLAGMLSLAALGVYTHNLSKLGIEVDSTVSETQGLNVHKPPRLTLHPAGSLYFGWVGAWVQVLGGAALLFGFKSIKCSSCHKQRLKDSAEMYEVNC